MKTLEERVDDMEERLARGDSRMGAIERDVGEVLSIVTMGKGFFRVMGAIGTMTKWTLTMCAAIGAVWAAYKHGGQP